MHDITDREQVEEALAGISRRLIEAQEQERGRIARELHDDIGQRFDGNCDFQDDRLSLLVSQGDLTHHHPHGIRGSAHV